MNPVGSSLSASASCHFAARLAHYIVGIDYLVAPWSRCCSRHMSIWSPGASVYRLIFETTEGRSRGRAVLDGQLRVDPDRESGPWIRRGWQRYRWSRRSCDRARWRCPSATSWVEFPDTVPVPLFGVPEAAVHARARHGGLEELLRVELVPPLNGRTLPRGLPSAGGAARSRRGNFRSPFPRGWSGTIREHCRCSPAAWGMDRSRVRQGTPPDHSAEARL